MDQSMKVDNLNMVVLGRKASTEDFSRSISSIKI